MKQPRSYTVGWDVCRASDSLDGVAKRMFFFDLSGVVQEEDSTVERIWLECRKQGFDVLAIVFIKITEPPHGIHNN